MPIPFLTLSDGTFLRVNVAATLRCNFCWSVCRPFRLETTLINNSLGTSFHVVACNRGESADRQPRRSFDAVQGMLCAWWSEQISPIGREQWGNPFFVRLTSALQPQSPTLSTSSQTKIIFLHRLAAKRCKLWRKIIHETPDLYPFSS